jgi:hypothetical protein
MGEPGQDREAAPLHVPRALPSRIFEPAAEQLTEVAVPAARTFGALIASESPPFGSAATMMFVQMRSSPSFTMCLAALPYGFLVKSKTMFVSSV